MVRKLTVDIRTTFEKTATKYGNGSHLVLPKEYIGKTVLIVVEADDNAE